MVYLVKYPDGQCKFFSDLTDALGYSANPERLTLAEALQLLADSIYTLENA